MLPNQILFVPAIYRFLLPGFERQCSWGWHKAEDLVCAINNILVDMGQEALSYEQFERRFVSFFLCNSKENGHTYYYVDGTGSLCSRSTQQADISSFLSLEQHIVGGDYLSARVFTNIVRSIRGQKPLKY